MTNILDRLLHQRLLWLALFIGYTLLLTFMSMNPWFRPSPSPDDLIPEDKVGHFVGYLSLSVLMGLAFWEKLRRLPDRWKGVLLIVLASTLYGGMIEVAQATLTDYRSGEWGDVLANGVGAAAGGLVLLVLLMRIRSRASAPPDTAG